MVGIHVNNESLLLALQMLGFHSIMSIKVTETKSADVEISSFEDVQLMLQMSPIEIAGRLARVILLPGASPSVSLIHFYRSIQQKLVEVQQEIQNQQMLELESLATQMNIRFLLSMEIAK